MCVNLLGTNMAIHTFVWMSLTGTKFLTDDLCILPLPPSPFPYFPPP